MTSYAIQERAVSENLAARPQGKGWQADIAYTLEARGKTQLVLPDNDNRPIAVASNSAVKNGTRFLSVCSGIEAASVAWPQWDAVAFSEIEKFPSAVLAHHYPDVPNLGDFTKIDTTKLGRVDVLAGGTPCFTAGHLVLTEKGYAPIEAINVGDKVVTHKGRLRTVVRIGNERKEVGVLTGVGMCESIICTPDHPFLAVEWRNQNTRRNNLYTKVEHCGDPVWVSASQMSGKQWCQLTAYDNDNREPESAKFNSKTAMYVAGVYLGDGWISKHKGKRKKSVTLGINPAKYKKLRAVIGNTIHTVSRERTIVRVSIHDTAFADWLEREFAHYSHLKTIPAWIMGHELRGDFLRGFLDADGHTAKSGKVSVSTTSRSLAYGVSDLLAAEGYVSSVAFVPTPDTCTIEGRTCNQKDYYQIRAYPLRISRKARVRHNMVLRAVTSFQPSGSETVFNIEVEEDHSYVVQGAIVHNCQAFSVAGKRGGLDDARGNLTLSFVELAHELANGNGLRNVVWENVPGVLSDKGNAFGCFLAGLVGDDAPLLPPNGKRWPNAGLVAGPKGRAAWRILDAQYFGLAQRRRRVIVIADFGNGADPAAVLFEREGVQRNLAPSREAGEGVAGAIKGRIGSGGHGLTPSSEVAPCAQARSNASHRLDTEAVVAFAPEIARCVATREGSSQDYETTTMVAVSVTGQIAHTLKAEGADASEDGTGRGTPIVAFGAPVQTTGHQGDIHPSLTAQEGNNGGGSGALVCFTAKDYGGDAHCHLSPTLRAGGHSGSHANAGVMPAVTVAIRGREGGATAELGGPIATALRASQGGGDKPHVLAFQSVDHGADASSDLSPTLRRHDPMAVQYQSAVRRLTPVECERLQGFPDNWTNIPWRGKPTSPDGPRYKALGNSWAVPLFAWLGRRIDKHMPPLAAVSPTTHNNNKDRYLDAA